MPPEISHPRQALASRVAGHYRSHAAVQAVALSGSGPSGMADAVSDVDLYVYCTAPLSLEFRAQIAEPASRAEIGNAFWEPGDEWVDALTGISLDVMFREVRWIEEQLDRVLNRHQPSLGYSTCFWYNVLHSEALFDRSGWFSRLQQTARQPYPSELQQAIVAKNYPLLRANLSSYLHQIELAAKRGDRVSLNHRITAFLASYFDVLFAVNRLPHPGEKRLVQFAERDCPQLPEGMAAQVSSLLQFGADGSLAIASAHALADGLENLLRAAHLLPARP